MLNRFRSLINFLLKSSNQHGVHSPFVYNYLTKGLYQTKRKYKNLAKQDRLLQATIDYFLIQEIIGELPDFLSTNKFLKKEGKSYTYKYLHYIPNIDLLDKEEIKKLIKSSNKNTLFYISVPYRSKKAQENWKQLYNRKEFHVSIDFYLAGILANRIEQQKEHFRLRL